MKCPKCGKEHCHHEWFGRSQAEMNEWAWKGLTDNFLDELADYKPQPTDHWIDELCDEIEVQCK